MSLENSSPENGNHLALYRDIERQLIPQNQVRSNPSTLSSEFYAGVKRPRTGLIFSSILFTLLLLTGLFMQYFPLDAMEPYRLTSLTKQIQSQVVEQANALSDHLDYEKCVIQKGVTVSTEPQYCLLNSTKYYKSEQLKKSSVSTVLATLPIPIHVETLTLLAVAEPTGTLLSGDKIYAGFASDTSQFASQMVMRVAKNISTSVASKLKQDIAPDSFSDFELTNPPAMNYLEIKKLDTTDIAPQYYAGFTVATTLVINGSYTDPKSINLVFLVQNEITSSVITYKFSTVFNDAVIAQYNKKCSGLDTEASKKCLNNSVFNDKSLNDKIQSTKTEVAQLFAFSS